MAERDTGEPQHPRHPLTWSNVHRPSHGSRAGVPAVGPRQDTQQWAHGMAAARDLRGPGARVRGLRRGRVLLRRGRPRGGREGGEPGDRQAQGVRMALRSLSTQLSGAQVGVTLTNLAIGFLAEPAIATLLETPLTAVGVPEARRARASP